MSWLVLFLDLVLQFLNQRASALLALVTDLVFPPFVAVGCEHAVCCSTAVPTPHLAEALLSASMAKGLLRNQW